MDKTSPSSFVHQDLWIIVQLLLMKSYFGFVHIEAYQYYLTYRFGVSQRAVILSSGASVLRCCSCRPFYFPSFSKWYCTVRWHIFFYMYHFKCIVYIVFKDGIRLNEWMPWSLWFAFAAETELCVCAGSSREHKILSKCLMCQALIIGEPGGKQNAIYMTPKIKRCSLVAFVFAWLVFFVSSLYLYVKRTVKLHILN